MARYAFLALFISGIAAGICFFAVYGAPARAESGRGRYIEQAIKLYKEKNDHEAMNRFMDILVKGTPSEKAIANDYLNRIVHRMNSEQTGAEDKDEKEPSYEDVKEKDDYDVISVKKPPAKREGKEEKEVKDAEFDEDIPRARQKKSAKREEAPRQEKIEKEINDEEMRAAEREEKEAEEEAVDKSAEVRENIESRLTALRKKLLFYLGKNNGVEVYFSGNLPEAVVVDSNLLFSRELNFTPHSESVLSLISGLMFASGNAVFLILPEGVFSGNIRILDMRRAVALSSYFTRRGISPARIDVNLTNQYQSVSPKLRSIRGTAVVFIYNKTPSVKSMGSSGGLEEGPQTSLGIYPTTISPEKGEGAIIEFSVLEPAEGFGNWKFRILKMEGKDSALVVKELQGDKGVYRQIYWNGKKDFFGEILPSGRYVAVLSVVDDKRRQKITRKPILLKSEQGAGYYQSLKYVSRGKKQISYSKAKYAAKKTAKTVAGIRVKRFASGDKRASLSKERQLSGRSQRTPPRASGEEDKRQKSKQRSQGAGFNIEEEVVQVTYSVIFEEGSAVLTPDGEKKIRQVADTMNYWPLAKLVLTGYAYEGEANAYSMAKRRANAVSDMLTGRYGVEEGRIKIQSHVVAIPKSMVEIKMVGKE